MPCSGGLVLSRSWSRALWWAVSYKMGRKLAVLFAPAHTQIHRLTAMKAMICVLFLGIVAMHAVGAPMNAGELTVGMDATTALAHGLEGMSLDAARGVQRAPAFLSGTGAVKEIKSVGASSLRSAAGADDAVRKMRKVRFRTAPQPATSSSANQRLRPGVDKVIQKAQLDRSQGLTKAQWQQALEDYERQTGLDLSRFNDELKDGATSQKIKQRLSF